MKQTTKLVTVLLAGMSYLWFHFYAMGYNTQNLSLHDSIPHLDKWEHFTVGAIISCLVITLTEKVTPRLRYMTIFSSVLFLAILFEVLEYWIPFNGQIFWGGLDDSVWDVIFGLLGTVMVIAFEVFRLHQIHNALEG
ncbi:MAG: hypothetical protein OEW62_04325 [Candidatus Bathyarchaeota archaeon]|nr:hypothetical protein [Candidatus Bathyarchaeota archaeon]MDH5595156.1 hypothetical protein [Candidatus Bathyarchaeota archaeon]